MTFCVTAFDILVDASLLSQSIRILHRHSAFCKTYFGKVVPPYTTARFLSEYWIVLLNFDCRKGKRSSNQYLLSFASCGPSLGIKIDPKASQGLEKEDCVSLI